MRGGVTRREALRYLGAPIGLAALGARARFAGQVDGDTHPDHRAMSLLVYDAWLRTGSRAALYYFEVLSGDQTQLFHPTDYVDISAVAQRKRDAVMAHASQDPARWYPAHERMSRFRGMEHGCENAEAFIRHDRGPLQPLPR